MFIYIFYNFKNYLFIFSDNQENDEYEEEKCICEIVKFNFRNALQLPSESENSSESEDDYFDFLKIKMSEAEFVKLSESVNHPLVTIKPIIKIYDERMGKSIIDLINSKIFFSVDEYQDVFSFHKKAEYMMALPNSYLPFMKKPINSADPICAPLYMNEKEIIKFCKPLMLKKDFYGKSKYGLSVKYNLDKKLDIQSNFIFHQRLFFDKILKERLTNKISYGKDAEYELPLTVYEPVTLLRRFCDVFCYLNVGFEEIYSKTDYDEEVVIRKLFSSLIAGFHKPLASQGIPLKALIGETYEVDSENGDLKLFAEVKNDNPIHIVYNLRWKKRKALLDGWCCMKNEFVESSDELRIKLGSINTLRLYYDNVNAYKTFTFNLPLRCCFKGIVDPINDKFERNMSADSFMYIKGETKSAIIGFNHITHNSIFSAFYGMITKTIVNYNEMRNGHSFLGVIFHNSGFSLENIKEIGQILQAFAVNSNRRIESIDKLLEEKSKNDKNLDKDKSTIAEKTSLNNDSMQNRVDPRFAAVSYLDFFEEIQEDENKGNEGISPQDFSNRKDTENNRSNNINDESNIQIINKKTKSEISLSKNDKTRDNSKNNNNKKNNIDDELLQKNNNINDNDDGLHKKEVKDANEGQKNRRINIYPYKIYYDLFKKTIISIYKLANSSAFISSFNMHFIYKLYIGSWAHLNFFEIAYQGNEMNEFYIKYRMGQVNARPISDFNLKKGLKISIYDNNFLGKYKELFGRLWKPVMNPLITDTRYREDLLWLLRFYEIVEYYPENERDLEKLDLYEQIRLEAFLNAGKWKEILEAYTYINISRRMNPELNEGKKK